MERNHRRENRKMYRIRLIGAVLPLALVSACASMNGKWSLAEVDPTAARRDFSFQSLTLQDDGTFYAERKEMGKTKSVSGTWTYEDGVLSLRQHDGERHTYDAKLEDSGKKLTLVRFWNGQHMTAQLEKRKDED